MEFDLQWLANVQDATLPSSALNYRAQAVLRHDILVNAAKQNSFGKNLSLKPFQPGNILFECIRSRNIGVTQRNKNPMAALNPFGVDMKMYQNLTLEEHEYFARVIIDGKEVEKSGGFKALLLNKPDPVGPFLPDEGPRACTVYDDLIANTADREGDKSRAASWMKDRLAHSPLNPDFEALKKIVDSINIERSRIALATSSLTIVAKTRTELKRMIAELRG